MSFVELTIKSDYLPTWGVWEGIRELIQNAKDAETEFGAQMIIEHKADTLHISNVGTTLPIDALLIGYTSKANNEQMIGKFGEGLKFGILALVNAGLDVKLRSGGEVWIPKIVDSKNFPGQKVLGFDISNGRKHKNRVKVEIKGLVKEDWNEIQERFTFSCDLGETIKTYSGEIFLNPAMTGRVYVKGIFVEYDEKLCYGYNLKTAELDRDRKMVRQIDKLYHINSIWGNATNSHIDGCDCDICEINKINFMKVNEKLYELLGSDYDDLKEVSTCYYSTKALEAIKDIFISKYGKDAYPVRDQESVAMLSHFGAYGVIVDKKLMNVLWSQMGNLEQFRKKLCSEAKKVYFLDELKDDEIRNLNIAYNLVKSVENIISRMPTTIVDFKSDNILGQYCGREIKLARKVLSSFYTTLETLIHEVAHYYGGDGEKYHIQAIEKIWSDAFQKLGAHTLVKC